MYANEKPKLLLLTPVLDNYGISRTAIAIANVTVQSGFDVTLGYPSTRPMPKQINNLIDEQVEIIALPMTILVRSELKKLTSPFFWFNTVKNTNALSSYLNKVRPDCIHLMSASSSLVLFSLFKYRNKLVHSIHENPRNWFEKFLLRRMTLIFAKQQITCSNYIRRVFRLKNAEVIHSGADVSRFALKLRNVVPNDKPIRMVCVGRLNQWKGQDDLIEVCSKLDELNFDFKLDLIGTAFRGQEVFESHLQDLINAKNLQGKVRMLGEVSDWSTLSRDYSICLVPSKIPEPFGKVVVEAMAAGLVVIATESGGVIEIINHRINGLLFKPGHVDEIVQLIQELSDNLDLAENLRRNARISAWNFSENITAQNYVSVIQRMIANDLR